MSLDVYLTMKEIKRLKPAGRIYVRRDGSTQEISREEWDQLFPGREPVVVNEEAEVNEVYQANITHNLNKMADEAGLYEVLWRPDEVGFTKACQLIPLLVAGLAKLKANPKHFRQFNPSNGWGSYEGLVRFVENYLSACREYPDADVSVWR